MSSLWMHFGVEEKLENVEKVIVSYMETHAEMI